MTSRIIWTRSTARGYGKVSRFGRYVLAHRDAWERANRPPEPGEVVRHTCDVRLCVNPGHLLVGTQADNMHDMAVRQRAGRLKLTSDKRLLAYALLVAGRSRASVARTFGVTPNTISNMISGRNHK